MTKHYMLQNRFRNAQKERNLAIEFAPILGSEPSNDLRMAAAEARVAVMRANVRPEELIIGLGTPGVGRHASYDLFH